jgi:hypothetical protein
MRTYFLTYRGSILIVFVNDLMMAVYWAKTSCQVKTCTIQLVECDSRANIYTLQITQNIYHNTKFTIAGEWWIGNKKANVHHRLTQGCPVSLVLFNIYHTNLTERWIKCKLSSDLYIHQKNIFSTSAYFLALQHSCYMCSKNQQFRLHFKVGAKTLCAVWFIINELRWFCYQPHGLKFSHV